MVPRFGYDRFRQILIAAFSVIVSFDRFSVVGITTGYELDDLGVGVPSPDKVKNFSPHHPDRLLGPPNLLSNGYRG
jgi:hypothetical protein